MPEGSPNYRIMLGSNDVKLISCDKDLLRHKNMMCDSRADSFCTASSNLLHKRNEKEVEVTEDNLEIIIITTNYKADCTT